MNVNRRQILKNFTLAVVGSALPAAVIAAPDVALTAQEKTAVDYLASQGVTKFTIMNKRRGRLLAIDQGQVEFSVPAITGAARGDDIIRTPGVTAAGIWPLRFSPEQNKADAVIVFQDIKGKDYAYVIHRALQNGPQQRRLDRLNGKAPFTKPDEDLRVSDGCINLRTKDYDLVSTFARSAVQIYGDNGPAPVLASFLVVLPESENLQQTRRFLENTYVGPEVN